MGVLAMMPERIAALELLYHEHHLALVRSLTVAAGDRSQAEDAVQDAFIQAFRHWQKVSTYDDPVAWVRRVAVNRILNQHRSARRRDAAIGRLRLIRPRDTTTEPFDADLEAAIAELPIRQRTALVLFYLEDLPVAAIADAMSISAGAVRYHLHAARHALASHLQEQQ